MGLVEEEADESRFWLELALEANLLPAASVQNLVREADELTAIAASSRKTARSKAQANQQ